MKKKKKIYFILIVVFVVITGSFFYFYSKKDLDEFRKMTTLLLDDSDLTKYFSNPVIKHDKSKVFIEFDLEESFDNLSTQEQFRLLELYNRQIRYFLQCGTEINHLYSKEYVITVQTKNNHYSFDSHAINKNVPLIVNSTLKINDAKAYDTNRLESEQIPINTHETVNGYTYEEIYNYAKRIFKLVSDNGNLYSPTVDTNVVLDAVMDKFGITFEEYDKVYKRYYFHSKEIIKAESVSFFDSW